MLSALLFWILAGSLAQSSDAADLSPLMEAARRNELHRVQQLVAKGADVNRRAKGGETALYEAIEWLSTNADNLPVVDALLKAGADPNEAAIFGVSPLELSLSRDHINPAVTLRLLEAGASVPQRCESRDSLVSLATQDSSVEVIEKILAKGSPVNCQDRLGHPALYWAAINGQADRVSVLLKSGADPQLRDKEGQRAIDVAKTTSSDTKIQKAFAKTRALLTSTEN